jgi:UDPglucose--hexose-1-phosphate uridylyltransferase
MNISKPMIAREFLLNPHRRWHALRQDWVLVSPHRTQRPWQGQTEATITLPSVEYDPACYLCPCNVRASGHMTPDYIGPFVFENDYAALLPGGRISTIDINDEGLLCAETELGVCRVICFDPRHDLTLATMEPEAIRRVIDIWIAQEAELGARKDITYVQIFENRGAIMGTSNLHPHGQIWATEHIPNEPARELAAQTEHFRRYGKPLLQAYLDLELRQAERIVIEGEHWIALVPFWAVWPFELLLLPRNPVATLNSLPTPLRDDLAVILKRVTAGYDRVFDAPFPYSMGFHPAPCDGEAHPEWQLHVHFYPPLLRSASVRKFMVGFELLGSSQRDITPEQAAARLRTVME